jgi:hypothetical protein
MGQQAMPFALLVLHATPSLLCVVDSIDSSLGSFRGHFVLIYILARFYVIASSWCRHLMHQIRLMLLFQQQFKLHLLGLTLQWRAQKQRPPKMA